MSNLFFNPPRKPFVRWLALVSGLALVGILAFRPLVSTPALAGIESDGIDSLRSALSSNAMTLAWTALAVFLVMSALRLALQASVVYDASFLGALSGPAWSLVSDTEWGRLWILRMGFAVATGGALFSPCAGVMGTWPLHLAGSRSRRGGLCLP